MALQILRVPGRKGVQWVREGWRLFFRQPLGLSLLFFFCLLFSLFVSSLPGLGRFALPLTMPLWFVVFMEASVRVERGEFPWVHTLIAPIKATRGAWRRMLGLSVIGLALYLGCAWLGSFMDDGLLFDLITTGKVQGKAFSEDVMKMPGFLDALSLMSLLHTVALVALWYAPALVCWHGHSTVKAVFASLWALKRNWRALGLYVLVWNAVFFILMFFGSKLLVMLFGATAVAIALLMPSVLILLTAMLCSLYPSYRDMFVNNPAGDVPATGDSNVAQ